MIIGYIEKAGDDTNTSANSDVENGNVDSAPRSPPARDLLEKQVRLLRAKEAAARANAEVEHALAAAKRADAEADALLAQVSAKRAEATALHAEAAAQRAEASHAAARVALIQAELQAEADGEPTPSTSTNGEGSPTHNDKKHDKKCPACHTSVHNLADCKNFKDAELNKKWEIINNEKLCFRCLKFRTKNHRCKTEKCELNGCKNVHHPLLHKYKEGEYVPLPKSEAHTYLMVVRVTVKGPAGQVQTWAISGSASQVSLIDSALAKQVGAVGPSDPIHAKGLMNIPIDAPESLRVTLTLINQDNEHYRVRLNTMDNLKLMPHDVRKEDIAHCDYLKDLSHLFVTNGTVTPKIMIGVDYNELFSFKEVRRGSQSQPCAILTPLGWLITGMNDRVPKQNKYWSSSLLIKNN